MDGQALIQGLSHEVGLGTLAPDDTGTYSMVFDGHLELRLLPEGRTRVLLHAVVGTLPNEPDQAEELLKNMLSKHLGHAKTADEVLSLDEDGKTLVLFRRLETGDQDQEAFNDAVERFVNAQEQLVASKPEKPLRPPPAMLFP